MKTKISLVLLSLGLVNASAYAGTIDTTPMPVSNDINVTAPDQTGMWSFGATAVLMQPTNKAFNYADSVNAVGINSGGSTPTVIDGSDTHHSVDDNYDWWFGADVTYAFPGNGRDVTLAYEGLHGTDTDSTASGFSGGNTGHIQGLVSDFTGLPYTNAQGETDTQYDAGDLLFGQKLDVGSRIRLHPFVGVRYAHLDLTDSGTYYGVVPIFGNSSKGEGTGATAEDSTLENQFDGIGPRLGSDAQINLGQGFSIRGRLGLSALIGSQRVTNTAIITIPPNNNGSSGAGFKSGGVLNAENNTDSQTRVIPEIDGRLGLNYTYAFNSGMALGIEAGWQATNYFNVVSDQYPVNLGLTGIGGGNSGGSGIGVASTIGNQHYDATSNFGLQGPYARLQLDVS